MFPLYVPFAKSDNIFGLFRHVYVFARFWGYISFSVNLNNVSLSDKVKISRVNRALLLIQISAYVTLLAFAFLRDPSFKKNEKKSILMQHVRLMNELAQLCGIIFVLADVVNRRKLGKVFRTFVHFDKEITTTVSTCSVDYKNAKKSINCYVAVWIALYFLASIFSISIYQRFNPVFNVVVAYFNLTTASGAYINVLSIYSFILYNAKIRFKVVNKSLRRSFEVNRKVTEVKVINGDVYGVVTKLAKLHGHLNDIIDDMNACYSIQVMLCFAGIFSFLVFGIYTSYLMHFESNYNNMLMATSLLLWIFLYLWLGLVVLYLGSSTISEARNTGVVIHECINSINDQIFYEQLLAFSLQLLHRAPNASCKLFSFDWTLLFSIIAALATYLLILIQFDSTNNKNQELAGSYCTPTQILNSTMST